MSGVGPALKGVQTRERIAELVANGTSLRSIAKIMRMNESSVFKAWKIIRADLGEQAI